MHGIGGTLYCLVRSGAVQTAHKDVAEFQRVKTMLDQSRSKFKAGVLFQSA